MPEPMTIVAGVITVVSNAWKISKDLYNLSEGIQSAPKHVLAVSADLKGLHSVLGSLRGLLDGLDDAQLSPALAPILENLQLPLDSCLTTFTQLSQTIHKFIKPSGDPSRSKWKGFRWQFTDKDVGVLRNHLAAYKLTVDVGIAAENL
jgi:hypothetical protein